jgi:hypothetical protein
MTCLKKDCLFETCRDIAKYNNHDLHVIDSNRRLKVVKLLEIVWNPKYLRNEAYNFLFIQINVGRIRRKTSSMCEVIHKKNWPENFINAQQVH